jgi:hypothetical protein
MHCVHVAIAAGHREQLLAVHAEQIFWVDDNAVVIPKPSRHTVEFITVPVAVYTAIIVLVEGILIVGVAVTAVQFPVAAVAIVTAA